MASSILKRLHSRSDFEHRITNRRQAVGSIGGGEEFRFHYSGPVGQRQKLHELARDLMMEALFDDQTAGDDLFTDMFAQPGHGTVGVPGDLVVQFQRMSADGKTEELRLPFQALAAGWLPHVGRRGGVRKRQQPALAGCAVIAQSTTP